MAAREIPLTAFLPAAVDSRVDAVQVASTPPSCEPEARTIYFARPRAVVAQGRNLDQPASSQPLSRERASVPAYRLAFVPARGHNPPQPQTRAMKPRAAAFPRPRTRLCVLSSQLQHSAASVFDPMFARRTLNPLDKPQPLDQIHWTKPIGH
ncbi:hypothetical protein GGTG_10014 [Gaeumannomyces tritici R3-111a-1]|uniref:Uncharacterized protein n=1 Tax=Gaeumannomyces tritici (strain R3-111a-1) TaxID=644352 RepID=J3P930_GAET3|nr:hypothetical protein GGTG_10014 [Gaeumannomyces tritici R3-111a-1]EJT73165.1 hypothetical protein GGTG_10014 [Gaeumannomyces tritici R3-111a-1]